MLDYQFDFSAASQLKRYPLSGIDVLVVGGGLGGMFAAINCYRKGHNVKVLESAKGFDNNGGFIRIGGSVLSSLDHFPGLRGAFELMDQSGTYNVFAHDGDTIMGPIMMPKTLGGPIEKLQAGINVHRSSLNRCLYEYVRELGIEVVFDVRVASYYDDDKKGGCVSKSGEKFEADLVIAADGVASHSGDIVINEEKAEVARSSGYAAYRCTYPAEEGYKSPNVAKRFHLDRPTMSLWIAPRGYAVIFTNDEVVNFHIVHPDRGDASERWDHKTQKDDVLTFVEEDGWSQDIRNMVAAAPEGTLFDWRLVFRNPKPNWCSPHGHVVQLGDAAHTFLPSSGNGATQALEDGIYLSTCLQLAGKHQIPLATRVYNKLRFERTSCAQKVGFKNRNNWIGKSKEEARQAWRTPVGAWIVKHDPEAYTYENYGKCVNHLLAGAPFENTNIPTGHKYVPWSMEDFLSGKADNQEDSGDWS